MPWLRIIEKENQVPEVGAIITEGRQQLRRMKSDDGTAQQSCTRTVPILPNTTMEPATMKAPAKSPCPL